MNFRVYNSNDNGGTMRRADKQIVSQRDIEQILEKAEVCRLAFAVNGEPYIAPMNFVYSGGGLYFHCAGEGKKLDLIRQNPKVCFEVETDVELVLDGDVPCRWGCRYRSIVGWGTAGILESEPEKTAALEKLVAKFAPGEYRKSFDPVDLTRVVVIKVRIESMTGKISGY